MKAKLRSIGWGFMKPKGVQKKTSLRSHQCKTPKKCQNSSCWGEKKSARPVCISGGRRAEQKGTQPKTNEKRGKGKLNRLNAGCGPPSITGGSRHQKDTQVGLQTEEKNVKNEPKTKWGGCSKHEIGDGEGCVNLLRDNRSNWRYVYGEFNDCEDKPNTSRSKHAG